MEQALSPANWHSRAAQARYSSSVAAANGASFWILNSAARSQASCPPSEVHFIDRLLDAVTNRIKRVVPVAVPFRIPPALAPFGQRILPITDHAGSWRNIERPDAEQEVADAFSNHGGLKRRFRQPLLSGSADQG